MKQNHANIINIYIYIYTIEKIYPYVILQKLIYKLYTEYTLLSEDN